MAVSVWGKYAAKRAEKEQRINGGTRFKKIQIILQRGREGTTRPLLRWWHATPEDSPKALGEEGGEERGFGKLLRAQSAGGRASMDKNRTRRTDYFSATHGANKIESKRE